MKEPEKKEMSSTTKVNPKLQSSSRRALHLSDAVHDRVKKLREMANKKDFGRKVSYDDVVDVLIENFDQRRGIAKIQERCMGVEDQTKKIHQEYCNTNGPIDFQEFVFKALTKQIDVTIPTVSSN